MVQLQLQLVSNGVDVIWSNVVGLDSGCVAGSDVVGFDTNDVAGSDVVGLDTGGVDIGGVDIGGAVSLNTGGEVGSAIYQGQFKF